MALSKKALLQSLVGKKVHISHGDAIQISISDGKHGYNIITEVGEDLFCVETYHEDIDSKTFVRKSQKYYSISHIREIWTEPM